MMAWQVASQRTQADHAEPLSREPHPSLEEVSVASQHTTQAHPLPAPREGEPSKIPEEHETEQAITAYVQELQARGYAPKTVQWHQTSLRALQHYLWRRFQLTEVRSLSTTCLQRWVNDLPIAAFARCGVRRTVSTVAAYARSARAFCHWLLMRGYVQVRLFPQGLVPPAPRGKPQPVEPEVFARLLRACQLAGEPGGQTRQGRRVPKRHP